MLRPIKDLTANWNVPLAEYLENYYEELTELHIDIDGQTAKVSKDSNVNLFDIYHYQLALLALVMRKTCCLILLFVG